MEIYKATDYGAFLELRNEWDALIDRIDSSEVFYLHSWADNYVKYYEPELKERLYIIYARDNGRLIAIFPFVVEKGVLTFITRHTSDYNSIYIDSNYNKLYLLKKMIENSVCGKAY